MRRKVKKRRSGLSLIEIVVSLLLMGLAVVVMGRLAASRIEEAEHLNYQAEMTSADAMMYSIYKDYKACQGLDIQKVIAEDSSSINIKLIFDLGLNGARVYEYRSTEGSMWVDGAEQFRCSSFFVDATDQHLYINLKLPGGQVLEYELFP